MTQSPVAACSAPPQHWPCRISCGPLGKRKSVSTFPVAVGGPITKIIDGYAADFQRENPDIKVTPIYAGTYQDTMTKAQTALKAQSGPQMAVLLSTDVFTLIDDDLVLPFDTLAKQRRGQGLAWQLLSGIPEERPDCRPYLGRAVPALDHRAVLEQGRVPLGRAESGTCAGDLAGACRIRGKLTQRNGGDVDRWGVQIPGSGLSVLVVPGAGDRGGRNARQCRRHRDRLRQSGLRRGVALLDRPERRNTRHIRRALWIGAPRRAISWNRRWR